MTPYDKLKQAVRDGDNSTVLFLLAWLDVGLTSLDRQHGTDHMETVDTILGEAFHSLDTCPGLREAVA